MGSAHLKRHGASFYALCGEDVPKLEARGQRVELARASEASELTAGISGPHGRTGDQAMAQREERPPPGEGRRDVYAPERIRRLMNATGYRTQQELAELRGGRRAAPARTVADSASLRGALQTLKLNPADGARAIPGLYTLW
jgi:hypothetical protein